MGWEHFSVGVDIYACSLGLDEQFLQVFQVMTADQNGWIISNSYVYFSKFWVSVSCGIGLIQKSHNIHTVFSRF